MSSFRYNGIGHTLAPLLITVSGTVTHGPTPPKIPPTKNPAVLPRVFAQTFILAPQATAPQVALASSTGAKPAEGEVFYLRADTFRFVG